MPMSSTAAIRVSRIGTKSFRMHYEFVRHPGAKTVARAESVQVMYDYENGRSKPLSEEQRQLILEVEDETAVELGA